MVLEYYISKALNKPLKLSDCEILLNRQTQLKHLDKHDEQLTSSVIAVGKNLLHLGNYNDHFVYNFWDKQKLLKKIRNSLKVLDKIFPELRTINLLIRPKRLFNGEPSQSLSNLLHESYVWSQQKLTNYNFQIHSLNKPYISPFLDERNIGWLEFLDLNN